MTAEARARERFLPADIPTERLATCVGLVADTHIPDRCAELPSGVFEVLHGVDLVLHAGDVGELHVLDQLSAIAPVIAVHGNDDVDAAREFLPLHQLLTIAGQRLLLTHTHYPDRAEELVRRKEDAWEPKLGRRAALGRAANASIVVFGHIHIPVVCRHEGILLVNPGALVAGSGRLRQIHRTVALLYFRDDGYAAVVHIDVATPRERYEPWIDWDAGYRAALNRVTASILSPEMEAHAGHLIPRLWALPPDQARVAWQTWNRVAQRCWSGQLAAITPDALLAEVRRNPELPAAARAIFESALDLPMR